MLRRIAPVFVVVACVTLALFAGGCASRPTPTADPLGTVPADFTIDVAVVSGGRSDSARDDADDLVPTELRSGRFIVFPNGDLHYARRDIRSQASRPPLVRKLSRDELARLWSLCQQTGLAEAHAMMIDEAQGIEPDQGEVAYVLAVQSGGVYRGVSRTMERTQAQQSAEAELVRELAALAWASELPPERAAVIPKRYDFGPDPYERYRKP